MDRPRALEGDGNIKPPRELVFFDGSVRW
jgi:hypothetical protein